MRGRLAVILLTGTVCAAQASSGVIVYQPETKVLMISGFPEEAPATMDSLLQADRQNKWGVVACDKTTDTYTVNASIYIGTEKDLGAYMQIGRKGHPKETVVVKGDIWIRTPQKSVKRSDGLDAIAHRLTLGDPKDAAIQATLKIDCAKAGEFALVLGSRTKTAYKPGGDLHVYNSTITAATPGKQHLVACAKTFGDDTPQWYCSSVRIVHSKLAWLQGPLYGPSAVDGQFENSTFENMTGVFQNDTQLARNCTFRNCGNVFAEGGCLSGKAVNCVFENNENNFTVGGYYGQGVTFVDCQVQPPKQPIVIRKNKVTPEQAIQQRVPLYPAYTEISALLIQVIDRRGRPISNAFVNVSCPEDPSAVRNGLAMTDAQGLTAKDAEKNAIFIVRQQWRATDDPTKPTKGLFLYTIDVQAQGYAPKQMAICQGQDIPKPLVLQLDRPGWFAGCRKK